LNASHIDASALQQWLSRLDELFLRRGESLPVVVDLQGAKMRVGDMPAVNRLPEQVRLCLEGSSDPEAGILVVPHPELFEQSHEGDELGLNEDRIRLEVLASGKSELKARVSQNGPLSGRKGINRRHHPVRFAGLSARDREQVTVAKRHPFVSFAFSFVHEGHEAQWLRAETDLPLVGKIERPEAMEHLPAIARAFDALWFCRGDLGAQAGLRALTALQHRFEAQIPALSGAPLERPCYLAGQVLEHLTHFEWPTRSEVVHLGELPARGWRGIVLSDETAVGKHPLCVAEWLGELLGTCQI
jgi:pyruvate kinase